MLSQFDKPPIVVCVLCRGSVSIRKGDKSRFYNHITNDHEVHFDLELFFSLCYLEKQEKDTFITVMNKKIGNGSSAGNLISDNDKETGTSSESMNEDSNESNEETSNAIGDNSIDREVEDPAPILSPPTRISDDTCDVQKSQTHPIDTPFIAKVTPVKKEKQRCPLCKVMVPKKSIHIHMKLKHKRKMSWNNRTASCQFCEKSMNRNNINRHLRKVHGIMQHKLEEAKNIHSRETTSQPSVKQEPPELEDKQKDDLKSHETLITVDTNSDEYLNINEVQPSINANDTADDGAGDELEIGDEWEQVKSMIRNVNTISSVYVKKEPPENSAMITNLDENVPEPDQILDMGSHSESSSQETNTIATSETENNDASNCRKCNHCLKLITRKNFSQHMKDVHSIHVLYATLN